MSSQTTSQAAQDDVSLNAEGTARANPTVPQGGRRREADIGKTLQTVLWSVAAVLVMFAAGAYLWSWFTSPRAAVQQPQNVQQPVVPTNPVQLGGNVLNTSSAGTSVMAQAGATGVSGTKQDVLPGPGSSTATSILTSEALQKGYVHTFGPAGSTGNNYTFVVPSACKIPEPQVNVTLPPITVDLTVPPMYQAAPVQQPTVPTTPTVPASPAPAVNPAPANPAPVPVAKPVTNVQKSPAKHVVGTDCHGRPVYGPKPWSE